jgi:alkaline phosphatase D
MRNVFLDFLGETQDSPRRKRRGIYEGYDLNVGRRKIRLVLLDVRFAKDTKSGDMVLLLIIHNSKIWCNFS